MFKKSQGLLMVFVVLTVLGFSVSRLRAQGGEAEDEICAPVPAETTTIVHAYLYIEYNYTDGDMGVHGYFDDHGWAELCVFDPIGNLILQVSPQAQLGDLTMAGIFFESREPELDEFGYEELVAAFPEGQYEVRGTNFDGTGLTGFATFTHAVPAAPMIVSPADLAEDDEAGREVVVSTENLVVEWAPVTQTIDGDPVEIVGYEVIVTADDYEAPHGFSQPMVDVHLPPDRTSLSIPPEFWQPDTLYEIEVLALEVSGNQTIGLGFFTSE